MTVSRTTRRFFPWLTTAAMIAVLLLAACGGSSSSGSGSSGGTQTLTFGSALSLTGSTATEGNLTKEGYELWKATVNAAGGIKVGNTTYKVDIKYYDDKSDPTTSKQLTQQLVTSDKVNFLLGPYGTPATLQDEAIAEQYQIPMVEPNGASLQIFSKGYKYIFGVLSPATEYAKIMVKAAMAQPTPPANIAIIYADDAFSQDVAKAAQAYAQSINLPVVAFIKYAANATDLTSVLNQVKTAAGGNVPDFVLGSGHTNEAETTIKTAKQLGINPKLWGFTVGPSTPDFISTLGADANDVIGSSQWDTDLKYTGTDLFGTPAAYTQQYVAMFGHQPAYQSADGTAAALAFQYAIQAAGSIDPAKVRDALANLDVQTFFGEIKFDSTGINTTKPMVTFQIQNGKLFTVYPANVASATMTYPTPPFGSR